MFNQFQSLGDGRYSTRYSQTYAYTLAFLRSAYTLSICNERLSREVTKIANKLYVHAWAQCGRSV